MARKGNTANTASYIRKAQRIGSRWNRAVAWWKGGSDGSLRLYGPSQFSAEFEKDCQWLRKQRQRAAEIQTQAEQDIQEWQRIIEGAKDKEINELHSTNDRILDIKQSTAGVHCEQPGIQFSSRMTFIVIMFVAEFFFSAVALITSGVMSTGFEIAISLVAAGVLVALSEFTGRSLRKLPLADSASPVHRYRHYSYIVIAIAGLIIALAAITFLRSFAGGEEGGSSSHQVLQYVLLAIGIGLVIIGIFRSGEHEYSGPKYGLARLESDRKESERAIVDFDTSLKRLADFGVNLEKISRSNVDKVMAIYSERYKRKAVVQERARSNAKAA